MKPMEHPLRRQLRVATAVGGAIMVTFWTLYFLANDALGLVEPAYSSFEESFFVADVVLAVLLFATSAALHRRRAVGPFLLVTAAAMCVYLGILDATFYARHELAVSVTGVALIELLPSMLCMGGGIYGLWAAWRMWNLSPNANTTARLGVSL